MAGLTNPEIMKIVYRYIGVNGGYLGSFSYPSHAEFYPLFCNLDINPYEYEGTTRERFITILQNSSPEDQASILRGVLQRFPLDEEGKPDSRTKELHDEVMALSKRIGTILPIDASNAVITSAAVMQAIKDLDVLIKNGQPAGCIDRLHTILYGYLRGLCQSENILYSKDDSMSKLFKLLRQSHPALNDLGPRSQDIGRVLNSFANILDALSPIRNEASVAHPTDTLLGVCEATLIVNVTSTLLNYLVAKFDNYCETPF